MFLKGNPTVSINSVIRQIVAHEPMCAVLQAVGLCSSGWTGKSRMSCNWHLSGKSLIARNISCNKYVTEPSAGLWPWQKKLSIISFTTVAPKIIASVTSTRLMKSQVLWGYVQEGTILCFRSLNTILIRRILLSEPCTVIFRMCSGLSYCFTMCFKLCFSVLFFSVRLISSVVRHVRLTCVY